MDEMTIQKEVIEQLQKLGWRKNIKPLLNYFVTGFSTDVNGNKKTFDFALFIDNVKTPVAIIEVCRIDRRFEPLKIDSDIINDAKKLNCPTVIFFDGTNYSIATTDFSFVADGVGSIPAYKPDVTALYSDFVTRKCNSLMTASQNEYFQTWGDNYKKSYALGGLLSAKVFKYYDTSIGQTCFIFEKWSEYITDYSIEDRYEYTVVDESGGILLQETQRYKVGSILKFSIFVTEL